MSDTATNIDLFRAESERRREEDAQKTLRLKDEADHNRSSQRIAAGWLGYIFGDTAEKAGNIAALVVTIMTFTIICMIFTTTDQDLSRKDIMSSCISIVTLVLGYLFGRAGGRDRHSSS